jgi:serine protease inhibitor
MKRLVATVFGVALAAILTGCASRQPLVPPLTASRVDVAVAAELPKTGAAGNALRSPLAEPQLAMGFRLLHEMRKGENGNILVSPLSLSTALAMTANGANGGTQTEMEQVLGIASLGRERSNAAYADLLCALDGSRGETLTVSNALWADSALPLKQDFLTRDRDFFGALLTRMSFGDQAGMAAAVNAWAAKQTHGKVTDLLDPKKIDPQTVMVLADAVYFRGAWRDPFPMSQTKPQPFGLLGMTPSSDRFVHQVVDVPTMMRSGEMQYLQTPEFQAVELPYKGDTAMYVFLPKTGMDLASFETSLTSRVWAEWTGRFTPHWGTLELPRFTVEAKSELREPLSRMGMPTAFSAEHADFTGLSPDRPLWISEVEHSVYVSVDETGTEAAAATAVLMDKWAASSGAPFEMLVDRPFFFAIVDKRTGAPLFFGSVVDPRGK